MKKSSLSMALAMAVAPLLPVALSQATESKATSAFSTHQRVKQVAYEPTQITEIVGAYGYQSTIEFAPDEQIKLRTLGDAIAWQIVLNGSRIFVKPLEINAATNMTIVTNKRTYMFRLIGTDKPNDMTYMVSFTYPDPNRVDLAAASALGKDAGGADALPATGDTQVEALPVSPPPEPLPIWTLAAGKSIGQELKGWADKAGWQVIWNLPTDWTIPADTAYEGEFPAAAAKVIETLAGNGALIRTQFYEGNKTMVINGPGVPAQ